MLNKYDDILNKASRILPGFRAAFDSCLDKSEQAIIFGSFACECENDKSDIDILFVGGQKRRLSRHLDFIWLRPEKLCSGTWLGSELATHISRYGVWAKGDESWKDRVFFSKAAITRKKERIFARLIHLLIKKEKLSLESKRDLFLKVLVNCNRLILLSSQIAIPPTAVSAKMIIQDPCNLLVQVQVDQMLGPTFGVIMREIFPELSTDELYSQLKRELSRRYRLNDEGVVSCTLNRPLLSWPATGSREV